jgi:hypothetical protein
MQITQTIEVDGFGDGFAVKAYQPRTGRHAGEDRVSMRISVADLASSPELLAQLAGTVVSFAFSPEEAALVAKAEPQTREAMKAAGVKVPATRRTK